MIGSDSDTIEAEILGHIEYSLQKVTPLALEKQLRQTLGVDRRAVKAVLKRLLFEGKLVYTNFFGLSFIEAPYQQPFRISPLLLIKLPRRVCSTTPDDVVIELAPGASFGTGRHPTTGLALQGVEFVLRQNGWLKKRRHTTCLDIGTGSGILALAALKFGIDAALGIDHDPCARVEAGQNARLNSLESRLKVKKTPLSEVTQQFDLIVANLRPPTLVQICSDIAWRLKPGGVVVLSGFKTEEEDYLVRRYRRSQFECFWHECHKGWSGMAFQIVSPK